MITNNGIYNIINNLMILFPSNVIKSINCKITQCKGNEKKEVLTIIVTIDFYLY